MKINSSDVQFSSSSRYSRTTEETVYTLEEEKNILRKSQSKLTEQRSSEAAASSHTGEDYTVDIREEAKAETVRHAEESADSSPDMNDDFDRNMYLSSVLTWAADTIDKLAAALEEQEHAMQGDAGQRLTFPSFSEETDSLTVLNTNPGKNRFEFLRTMADELRAKADKFIDKADALSPADQEGGASRMIKTTRHEKERTVVQSSGLIRTADGREIGFSLDVDMQRERESVSKTMETFRFIDPLVINFSGTAAQLSDEKRSFDLNNDGIAEEIAQLQSGSGFLALDLNEDGIINNGGELFGPSTGNGFQELALFDEDNNHWIDENDEIYEKLTVWTKDESGEDVLRKLSETGIGAIHLGYVASGFSLQNSSNETVGQVVSTGIALTEAGEVKTVQQIDLVV
ncbi:MAG: hypothetical protein GY737_09030 [Desulfobacteraceae bacterium]|nr:hypothetical protein [Desulfobacteraceae bacterium]